MRTRYLSILIIVCALGVLPTIVDEVYATYGSAADQVQTITAGTTFSTSLSQGQQIVNRAFKVVSVAGTSLHCQLYNLTFAANEGQYVSGNFTSVVPLDFYIVTGPTYQNWVKNGNCGSAADALASKLNTMTYNFNGTITSSGSWDIVLVNSSNRDADGFLTAYLSSSSYTLTQPILATTTIGPSYTSVSITPSIPGFPTESIAVGALVGVVLLMALRRRRRA